MGLDPISACICLYQGNFSWTRSVYRIQRTTLQPNKKITPNVFEVTPLLNVVLIDQTSPRLTELLALFAIPFFEPVSSSATATWHNDHNKLLRADSVTDNAGESLQIIVGVF